VDKPNLTQSDIFIISPVCNLRNMVNILCNQLCTLAITIHNSHIILYHRKSSLYIIVFVREYNRPFIIINVLNYGGFFNILFLLSYELLLYRNLIKILLFQIKLFYSLNSAIKVCKCNII